MGDFRVGEPGSPSPGVGDDDEGIPLISSSSVTTRPFAVISLLRTMRRWGKRPRAVWTCCRMSEFLKPRIRKEKHEHPGVDLLVDTGEYIENDVVSKLWINVP